MSDAKENRFTGAKIRGFMVNALSGMALGLFSTLIIGLIIQQIAAIFGDSTIGILLDKVGRMATMVTGAGIGVGIASNLNGSKLAMFSSAVTGFIGANAAALVSGALFVTVGEKTLVGLSGPGDPLGAMIAGIVGVECSKLIAGKTKVDILLVPLTTIVSGAVVAYFVGPPIASFMTVLGELIGKATEMQPFIMGIILSAAMGTCLTFPLSSAALSIILNLNGLPAGAATVGCCCQMIGFAAASFRENGFQGLIAQGVGTSKIQLPNIIKNPYVFLPSLIASIILGPVSTVVFKMTNNPAGSGMGTSGFVGQIMTWQTMVGAEGNSPVSVGIKIVLLHFVFPALLAFGVSEILRKKGLIKFGDLKLDV